ncbi:MAG: hypothetical protein MJ252_14395 [archaeon]|nr:hypothetical protein [archaeon]
MDDEFQKKGKEQMIRFGKEIPFRKEQEEAQRKLEEERAARKKKKAK